MGELSRLKGTPQIPSAVVLGKKPLCGKKDPLYPNLVQYNPLLKYLNKTRLNLLKYLNI